MTRWRATKTATSSIGWFAVKRAATPEGLLTADEGKLFSYLAYTANPTIRAYNDAVPGGLPEHDWSSDPELSSCVALAEPALLAHEGTLYASFFCFRSAMDRTIELVGLDHTTDAWTHRGTLLLGSDSLPGVSNNGFNGPDLVLDESGDARLIASPAREDGGGYLGCAVYPLDLDAGSVGTGELLVPFLDVANNFQTGPCTYAAGSELGIMSGNTYITSPQFEVYASGVLLE